MSTRFGALASAPGGEKIIPSPSAAAPAPSPSAAGGAEPVVLNAPAPNGIGSEPPTGIVLAEEKKA